MSKTLAARAGPSVKQECQSSPLHQSSCYRVTRSGNLACKYIIHTLSPHQAAPIATILTKVLSFADTTLKVTSLALPAIGTGKQSKIAFGIITFRILVQFFIQLTLI